MALTPTVLFDAYVNINSNVVSDHGNKVGIKADIEDLETTTFGQTWKTRVGGLADGSVDVSFLNDFVAAQLDSIMWAIFIARTPVTFEIRPTSAARSAGNPAYTGSLLLTSWAPISGDVGKLASVDISAPTSGTVARQTS